MLTEYLRMPKNFMTPEVMEYVIRGNRLIELSKGYGLDRERIWGVTEINITWVGRLPSEDKCFTMGKRQRGITMNFWLNNAMSYIYSKLLRLDCAVLKSDSWLVKKLKYLLLKPVGFYFRKKYFNLNYK